MQSSKHQRNAGRRVARLTGVNRVPTGPRQYLPRGYALRGLSSQANLCTQQAASYPECEHAQQDANGIRDQIPDVGLTTGNELLAPNGLLQSRQVKKHFEALFARKWKECGAPPKPG